MMNVIDHLGENIAAIATETASHNDYGDFVVAVRDELGGRPGIWCLFAIIGQAFTTVEFNDRVDWESGNYVLAIGNIVARMIEQATSGDGIASADWPAECGAAIHDTMETSS